MWAIKEIYVNSGLPIATVPCLHQSNVHIKRKLWGRRAQKYNRYEGAISPQICTGRKSTTFYAAPYVSNNGKLRKFGDTYHHGTVFTPKQCAYQKEGRRARKYNHCVGAKSPQICTGRENARFMQRRIWVYWKFTYIRGYLLPRYRVYTKAMCISKGSYGEEEPENTILAWVQRAHKFVRSGKIPGFMLRRIWTLMQSYVNSGLPIATVQCLHQSNLHIKGKLCGRRVQK